MTAALRRDLADWYGEDFDRFWKNEGHVFNGLPDDLRLIDLQHARNLFSEMGMCGCGNAHTGFAVVRGLLNAIADDDRTWQDFHRACGGEGAFHVIIGALDKAGLVEHGGSVYGPWLTKPKGVYFQKVLSLVTWDQLDNDNASSTPHFEYNPDETPACSVVRECDVFCWEQPPGDVAPRDPTPPGEESPLNEALAELYAVVREAGPLVGQPEPRCYTTPSGLPVHVRPGCPHQERG